jgi:uncharacterized repeat protein (TIGR01451 family)
LKENYKMHSKFRTWTQKKIGEQTWFRNRFRFVLSVLALASCVLLLAGRDASAAFLSTTQPSVSEQENLLADSAAAAGQVIKLNPSLVAGGNVSAYHYLQISPDGSKVVYAADQNVADTLELFSVPIDGGAAVKLNVPLPPGGGVGQTFRINADSSRVVYTIVPTQQANKVELYSVPINGGPSIKLNPPLGENGGIDTFSVDITPDDKRVVYEAVLENSVTWELYSVPIGGGETVKLNPPLVAGGLVNGWSSPKIGADSSRVVYRAEQDTDGVYELYSVPIAGGQVLKLNPPLVPGGNVGENFYITPDGTTVVYIADQDIDGVTDLYRVPITGGPAVKLNPPYNLTGSFQMSADGNRIVYLADQNDDNSWEMYSMPTAGGASVQLFPLSGIAAEPTVDYQISSTSSHVVIPVYLGPDQGIRGELYSVPIDGGSAVRLDARFDLVSFFYESYFQISPDGKRVLYSVDRDTNEGVQLYTVPINGGNPARVTPFLPVGQGVQPYFKIGPNGARAVYTANQDMPGVIELYSAALQASALNISKQASAATAKPGEIVTYTVTVTARDGFAPTSVVDALPPGVTFQNASRPDVSFDIASRQLRYSGTLEAGNPFVFSYTVAVDNVAEGSVLYSEATATAFGQSYAAGMSVAVPRSAVVPTLNLVYANGDNDLATSVLELFQKAETAAGNPTMTTLLLFDGPENGDAYLYRLKPDLNQAELCPTAQNPTCNGRYQENVTMWPWGEAISTKSSLASFVTQAMAAYPSTKVTLSLVGHGGGWSPDLRPGQPKFHDGKPDNSVLGGLLWDDHPYSSLSTRQLGDALETAVVATGRRIDLLYLDACLMAMSEVAYEVRNSVNYLLASESWSWTSFRYDLHLALNGNLPAEDLGKQWIDNEAQELRGSEDRTNYPFTYSLLDISAMAALLDKENTLADALYVSLTSNSASENRQAIRRAFFASACFDGDQDYQLLPNDTDDYYCDLRSFAQKLQREFGDQHPVAVSAKSLEEHITEVVLRYNAQNNGRPWKSPDNLWAWDTLGGLSKYMPLGVDDWKRRYYTAEFLDTAQNGRWDEFLSAYWAGATPPEDPPACSESCRPLGPNGLNQLGSVYLPFAAK